MLPAGKVPEIWMGTREAAEYLLGAWHHERSPRVIYNLQKQIDQACRHWRDLPKNDPNRLHIGLKAVQRPSRLTSDATDRKRGGRWVIKLRHLEAWAELRSV